VWAGKPAPWGWYDNGAEHLALAAFWLGMGHTAKGFSDKAFVFYELSRAEVQDTWPVWWGWTFVHFKRGRHVQAGQSQGQLAESPYLDPQTRDELRQSAKALREGGDPEGLFGVLGKGKAAWLIGKALLARAGGIEGIASFLLTEQDAAKVNARLQWMARVSNGVSQHMSVRGGVRAAKGLGDRMMDWFGDLLADDEAEPAP